MNDKVKKTDYISVGEEDAPLLKTLFATKDFVEDIMKQCQEVLDNERKANDKQYNEFVRCWEEINERLDKHDVKINKYIIEHKKAQKESVFFNERHQLVVEGYLENFNKLIGKDKK